MPRRTCSAVARAVSNGSGVESVGAGAGDAGSVELPAFVGSCGRAGQSCCAEAPRCARALFCAENTGRCTRCGGFEELAPLAQQAQSNVNALSADGSTAVGWSGEGNAATNAVSWSLGSPAARRLSAQLGPAALRTSEALATSREGSVSVGFGVVFSGGAERALAWRDALAQLDEGRATGVSADGRVIVGTVVAGSDAFRWTVEGALERLPKMTDGSYLSARALSADGQIVVGEGNNGEGERRAFRWTRGGGPVGIGALAGGRDSWASSVAADGATVVGVSTSSDGPQVFRWTVSEPMRAIAPLGQQDPDPVLDASGSRIVGGSAGEAFLWESGSQTRLRLIDVLGELVPSGWRLHAARGSSDDALVFVGNGTNPNGELRAWRAVLGPSCPAGALPAPAEGGR